MLPECPARPGIAAAALGASASAAPGTGESAAPCAGESALSGAPTEALHTFTLDSGASRSFFTDSTTLTLLSRLVAVSLADPSGGPVLAHSSKVLPCPAAPSGLLSGLHLPSFSTNLVSGADLQFALGGQRVTHCTCSRTGRHLAMFTRRPRSSLYTLTTAPPPVSASGQVAASSQVFATASRSSPASAPCSCRPLTHETLLWHHRLGHPSLPRLRSMASRTLVSGLPRCLPPLPPGPAPTCVPCVEGRQRAAPHSSSFPPTEAPLQTLHIDRGSPADSPATLNTRRIGMVMDVARTSMIHAVAPHFLWPFAVQYAAHQINLQPRVSLPETTPTLSGQAVLPCRSLCLPWLPSRRVLSSQDVTFDDSVSYYHLFPYHAASLPPSPLFLVPGTPPVDPLPPPGPAPSDVSQVDLAKAVEVAVDSGATRGAEPPGAGTGDAEPGGAEPERNEPGGADSGGAASVIDTICLNVPKTKDRVHRRISAEWLQTLITFCRNPSVHSIFRFRHILAYCDYNKWYQSTLEQFRQWLDLRKGVAELLVAVEKLKLKANPMIQPWRPCN
ncbi:unnamed protein product [Closterium sp. NIES-53]